MKKIPAFLIAEILKCAPRRIGQAIFYRIPAKWFRFDVVVPYMGSQVKIWTGENIGRKIFFLRDFEAQQLEVFRSLVSKDTVLFDVGANIGVYSLIAGKQGAKVFSFEPSPEVIPYLEANMEINKYDITHVNEAVGDKQGTISFYVSTKENMGVGRIMEFGKRTDKEKPPVEVRMDTLDHYVEKFGMPTLIKMDIEGAEYFALKGGEGMLRSDSAPVMMVEFHPKEIKHFGSSADELMKSIRSYGYHQYAPDFAKNERWHIFSKKPLSLPKFTEVV